MGWFGGKKARNDTESIQKFFAEFYDNLSRIQSLRIDIDFADPSFWHLQSFIRFYTVGMLEENEFVLSYHEASGSKNSTINGHWASCAIVGNYMEYATPNTQIIEGGFISIGDRDPSNQKVPQLLAPVLREIFLKIVATSASDHLKPCMTNVIRLSALPWGAEATAFHLKPAPKVD